MTCGATALFLWHFAVTPTDFLQVGLFTWVLPPAPVSYRAASVGLKARLLRSRRWRPGLALGANYSAAGGDTRYVEKGNTRAVYAVCGWTGDRWGAYVGAFPRWATISNEDYYSPGYDRGAAETTYAMGVGFGLAARVGPTNKALLEFWIPGYWARGVGVDAAWASLLGLRRFGRATSADLGLILLKPTDERVAAGLVFNLSFYF